MSRSEKADPRFEWVLLASTGSYVDSVMLEGLLAENGIPFKKKPFSNVPQKILGTTSYGGDNFYVPAVRAAEAAELKEAYLDNFVPAEE